MDYQELNDAIKKGVSEKLGDDVTDVSVAVDVHESYMGDIRYTTIAAKVYSVEVIIIRPATRLDMIKAGMPNFIRRWFPPKTTEEIHFIGIPGSSLNIRKRKIGALIHYVDEITEEPEVFVKWCVENGSNSLRELYTNNTIKVM